MYYSTDNTPPAGRVVPVNGARESNPLIMASCCAASPFASASALAGSSLLPPADLSAPGALRAAARARSYKSELILFSFDFCGIAEAISLVVNLRRSSFEHFLPLSDGLETCEALRSSAATRGVGPLPCFYSSWPSNHSGWKLWGTAPGCVSAARASHSCVLEQLWTTRYHVAGRLLGLGDVNLLHVDTDSAILSDPYAVLKSPPYGHQNLIVLAESPVNGGMWYAQNTSDGFGAQWVIAEVARRTLATIELPILRKTLPPFDQAMLGDVLFTAADGGMPHWGSACEHPTLRPSLLCDVNTSRYPRAMRWEHRSRLAPPNEALAASLTPLRAQSAARPGCIEECRTRRCIARCSAPSRDEARTCAEGGRCRTALLRSTKLRVWRGARVEYAAVAAQWLFPGAWKAQQLGTFARRPPALAIAHLLGVRCRWCETSEDTDHGGRMLKQPDQPSMIPARGALHTRSSSQSSSQEELFTSSPCKLSRNGRRRSRLATRALTTAHSHLALATEAHR